MSKIVKNSGDIKSLSEIKEDLIMDSPSPAQRRAKTKFWSRRMDLGNTPPTLAEALQVTGEPGLKRWWNQPGFQDWFSNSGEAKERLEYLWHAGMDAIENIFLDPDANHNAKVQAFKIVAQLAGKEPSRTEKYADESIQKMSKEMLKDYIKKNMPRLDEGEDDSEGERTGADS